MGRKKYDTKGRRKHEGNENRMNEELTFGPRIREAIFKEGSALSPKTHSFQYISEKQTHSHSLHC